MTESGGDVENRPHAPARNHPQPSNSENDEPATEIRKRDESRRIWCSTLLRKMAGNHKKVGTREDVNQLYEDYGKVFIIGDIICFKSRSKFRKENA